MPVSSRARAKRPTRLRPLRDGAAMAMHPTKGCLSGPRPVLAGVKARPQNGQRLRTRDRGSWAASWSTGRRAARWGSAVSRFGNEAFLSVAAEQATSLDGGYDSALSKLRRRWAERNWSGASVDVLLRRTWLVFCVPLCDARNTTREQPALLQGRRVIHEARDTGIATLLSWLVVVCHVAACERLKLARVRSVGNPFPSSGRRSLPIRHPSFLPLPTL